MDFDRAALWNVGIAVLSGLAIGIERQWSGKAEGPKARFAGLRTFTLLGLVAGLSGWLWAAGLTGPAVIFLAGLGALVVVAYQAASKTDIDGTTEVAAFVVLATGVLAGSGYDALASGITAVTALLLVEKRQLHSLVSKLDLVEVRAGARFAVMAAVILPLLPEGPYGPLGGIRPRQLWALVIFFSGLSFVGYIARRAAGPERGYALAGTLGGMVSSTSVTLTFSRLSRSHQVLAGPLAAGVIGANLMLFPRVLLACLVIERTVAVALWPAFVAPAILAALMLWSGIGRRTGDTVPPPDDNPLQLRSALQMAVLFQLVLFGVTVATTRFGLEGLFGTAALLGLTDVDALTMSMSSAAKSASTSAGDAATAITIGVFVNTLVKLGLAVVVGRGAYRVRVGLGLTAIAAAIGATLLLYF